MSESVTLLVASVYAEAIEAVKSRAALSAYTPELISILDDINSEARNSKSVRVRVTLRLTVSQSVLVSSPVWGS
jgi:hypothetical protein